jgi:hypothetical protein
MGLHIPTMQVRQRTEPNQHPTYALHRRRRYPTDPMGTVLVTVRPGRGRCRALRAADARLAHPTPPGNHPRRRAIHPARYRTTRAVRARRRRRPLRRRAAACPHCPRTPVRFVCAEIYFNKAPQYCDKECKLACERNV